MTSTPITQIDTVSLKIPHHLVKKLDDIAIKEDRSRSSLIRKLIVSYTEDYEDIVDAVKARSEYEKNPNSAISLDQLIKNMKASKKS